MDYIYPDMDSWARREHYAHYIKDARCNFSITADIDVTTLVKAADYTGRSFYASLLYSVCNVINRHEEFRMQYVPGENKPRIWNEIHPAHAVFHDDDETFTVVCTRWDPDFDKFYAACEKDVAAAREYRGYEMPGRPENSFEVSSMPWLYFTGFNTNDSDKDGTYLAPTITWGRFRLDNGKYMLPITVQIHHAAADGFHVTRFYCEAEADAARTAVLIERKNKVR